MNFVTAREAYEQQSSRRQGAMAAHLANGGKHGDYDGPQINYKELDSLMIQAAQDQFGYSFKQAQFIHGITYTRCHSCYGDMFFEMEELCEQLKRWDALKSEDA